MMESLCFKNQFKREGRGDKSINLSDSKENDIHYQQQSEHKHSIENLEGKNTNHKERGSQFNLSVQPKFTTARKNQLADSMKTVSK